MISDDKLSASYLIAGQSYTMRERTLDDEQRLVDCELGKLAVAPDERDPFQIKVWVGEGLLAEVLSVVLRDADGQRHQFTADEIGQITASTRNELIHDFFFLNDDLPGFLIGLANSIPQRRGPGAMSAGPAMSGGSISRLVQ